MGSYMSLRTSRREFLVVSAAALAARPVLAGSLTGNGQARYTGAVGQKFHSDGSPRPFPGSTQLSHIPLGSALHKTLGAILDEAAAEPVMRKFVLMPKSSLHMTLMDGIDDEHRAAPFWPAAVPVTASLETAREWCASQLSGFHTGLSGDFTMVRRDVAPNHINSFTVPLKPADLARDHEMRVLRNRLSDRLGIRSPGHDTYSFHITLGYLIEYLTPDEASAFQALYQGWMDRLFALHPVITIGRPEFCYFADMFAFETHFVLQD